MKKLLFIILFTMLSISGYTLSVKADSDNYEIMSFNFSFDTVDNLDQNMLNELYQIIIKNGIDIDNDGYYYLTVTTDSLNSVLLYNMVTASVVDNRFLALYTYNTVNDFEMSFDTNMNQWVEDGPIPDRPFNITLYYYGINNDPIPDNDNNLFILVASTIALIIVVALSLIFKIKWLLIPASLLVLIPIIYVDNLLFKTSLVIVFIALIFITFYQEKGDQFE